MAAVLKSIFTEEARLTIVRAKHQADRFGSLEIDPENILFWLC
jgi:hypothetical protein